MKAGELKDKLQEVPCTVKVQVEDLLERDVEVEEDSCH